jgi:uncharacterized protein YdaU (DUF1376 family)
MSKPAPYPADTRAKGWRFELDHERIRQSDTWALAPAEARPWLLMLWMVAWEQTPCGSLPADDALVAARIGMPAKVWTKHKAVLLRGWWVAEDGRRYHQTLVERVNEMMQRRRKESDRKALARQRRDADSRDIPAPVPRDTQGTTGGLHPESDTGTGTGTSNTKKTRALPTPPPEARADEAEARKPGTPAGEVCKALRAAGIPGVSPSHPELLALLEQGVTVAMFAQAAAKAVEKRKGFAYALGVVKGQLQDAAAIAQGPGAAEVPWDSTRSGIEAMAEKVGIGRWDEAAWMAGRGEQWPTFLARVRAAVAAAGELQTEAI